MFTISSVTLLQTQARRSLFESQKWGESGVQRAVRLRLDQLLVDWASLGRGRGRLYPGRSEGLFIYSGGFCLTLSIWPFARDAR